MDQYQKYSKIFNNWEVTGLIGSGSYGKVFEMERREADVVYKSALKVISIPRSESEIKTRIAEGETQESIAEYYGDVAKQLLNEIRIMAELKGRSNIVSYEDHMVIYHKDGIGCDIFIRMELLTTFIDYMADNEMDEQTIIRLGIDICRALEICNRKNIIHRDIKPENIFVSDTGDFKLGDFGIARTIERTEGELSKKGTYRFMAPEVYKVETYGKTADICSLGLVLYYLANGRRTPFLPGVETQITVHDEEEALLRRMRGEQLPPPRVASDGLTSVIMKACSYNAGERYEDAIEMKRDLELLATKQLVRRPLGDFSEGKSHREGYALQLQPATILPENKKAETPRRKSVGMLEPKSVRRRRNVILAVLILIALIVGFALMGSDRKDERQTGVLEKVDKEGLEVLSSDWDWESSTEPNPQGKWPVYGILYVENNTDNNVVKAKFSVKDGNENVVTNADSGGTHFTAYGYVNGRSQGFMIVETSMNDRPNDSLDESYRPKDGTYKFSAVYTNRNLEDYCIPEGRLEHPKGENDDYYDVILDNKNDIKISRNALIVTVRTDGDTVEDFDGTGKITASIPARKTGYEQEIAFTDPKLHARKEKGKYIVEEYDGKEVLKGYKVFAIDRDLYDPDRK